MAEEKTKKTNPLVDPDIQTTQKESFEYKSLYGKGKKSENKK